MLYGGEDEYPKWMQHSLATVSLEAVNSNEKDMDGQPEFGEGSEIVCLISTYKSRSGIVFGCNFFVFRKHDDPQSDTFRLMVYKGP
ncbi:hypothetical protein FRX31_008871 [Thalictrum thalictroides]|uniref:Uncharacterized protein n=1 Tax=Thalictrum thalictroides TaxID=46969 RepID=A0A7J6WZK0_THATH|nr:hypothetical protein FRX31_008871 [Thalictrum thalictroides]